MEAELLSVSSELSLLEGSRTNVFREFAGGLSMYM